MDKFIIRQAKTSVPDVSVNKIKKRQLDESDDTCDAETQVKRFKSDIDVDTKHDISDYMTIGKNVDSDTKLSLINHRKPMSNNFQVPTREYKDKSKKNGVSVRTCHMEWLDTYDYLAYSQKEDGLYCLSCVLFPVENQTSGRANNLVNKLYTKWKDTVSDLKKHAVLEYHKNSQANLNAFMDTMAKPEKSINVSLDKAAQEQIQQNREVLKSIISGLEFCGRQGIALRGHRDDDTVIDQSSNAGNFKAILDMRVKAGDKLLAEHLDRCAKNAKYTSKTAQNDLLNCIKEQIQGKLVDDIKSQPYGSLYGIQGDEVNDCSNWEQFGLVVRYIVDNRPQEKLFEFINVEVITGKSLAQSITTALRNLSLSPEDCRSKSYDGAGNMAGHTNGCAAIFKQVATLAEYYHCMNHDLNLVVCKSCKIPEIQCMLSTVTQLGLFFKYSAKKQRKFEESVDLINEERKLIKKNYHLKTTKLNYFVQLDG